MRKMIGQTTKAGTAEKTFTDDNVWSEEAFPQKLSVTFLYLCIRYEVLQ